MKSKTVEDMHTRTLKTYAFNILVKQHISIDEENNRHELGEEDRKLFMDNVKIKKSEDGEYEITKGSFWKIGDEINKAVLQAALKHIESLEQPI
jgi:hypothetical protein